MVSIVIGLFETPHEAQLVSNALIDSGIPKDDISLILWDEKTEGTPDPRQMDESRASAERITSGVTKGAATGGTLGFLAGLGSIVIPGVGPVLAAGPIAAAIGGAGFGAIFGGFAGTVSDVFPPETATRYAEGLRSGNALVVVYVESTRAQIVIDNFENRGALQIDERHDPTAHTTPVGKEGTRRQPIPPVP
jgi:hypothetical protein